MDSIYTAIAQFQQSGYVKLDADEKPEDVTELVAAFAEAALDENPLDSDIHQTVAIAFSVFGWLTPVGEKVYGLNPIFPKPDDVHDYIRRQRKRLAKDASKDPNKRTDAKARTSRTNVDRLKNGDRVQAQEVFAFYGVEP